MLNSDDFFIPKAIEKLFEYTINNKLDFGYGKMAIKKNTGIHKYYIQDTKIIVILKIEMNY